MSQEKIKFPDYNHSILNLITSILNHYEVENGHTSLSTLDTYLEKDYQNVVLLILDGMGENVLQKLLPNGFLEQNKKDTITSIFPPTTAAALSVYFSGKAPIENGWIAFTQYFKEFGRNLDMLSGRDSYTGETVKGKNTAMQDIVCYLPVYQQIEKQQPQVKAYEIKPAHCDARADVMLEADDMEQICKSIVTLCKSNEKKYVFAYLDDPDRTLHRKGTYSDEAKEFLEDAQLKIEAMCKQLEGTNTLLIICADHGHTPIETRLSTLELKEFQDYYILPPSLEPRFLTFWIKKGKEEEFRQKFENRFANEFLVYSKQEFLNMHLLGEGEQHPKIDDFIGDFVALATDSTMIKIETEISKEKYVKLSNHCGITKDEMEVPLIIIERK